MVEPNARDGVQLAIESVLNGLLDNLEGDRVAGIGLGRIAVNVAGELIEKQYGGERAIRRCASCREFTQAGLLDVVAEAGADFVIDRGAAGIPPIAACKCGVRAIEAGPQPEFRDFGDLLVQSRVSIGWGAVAAES